MTEAEWLSEAANPQWMAFHLTECKMPRTKAGRRKLRLFACGCCRVTWGLLPDDRLRGAVEVAERFADGRATKMELAASHMASEAMRGRSQQPAGTPVGVRVAIQMVGAATNSEAFHAAFMMTATELPLGGVIPQKIAGRYICNLFRDIFGNPFRPVTFSPSWLTPTTVAIAEAIYADRAFDRVPILADALQDAGCEEEAILAHCRGDGVHVRGCWVVDGVLGKG
ncbi:hypothetical protein [Limnoglobus roseus]|uniref:SMI1/KNR4 family protein n=1 Tax=Limnoglobus roseus TaxID=2598579 RepID=A0A5C1AD11_9BACT|nr:hypothetical protein [Limnoglobus roseus]QEL15886.1 hypothetical protein PX52LOC_02822 [Limnoglobus roseus]